MCMRFALHKRIERYVFNTDLYDRRGGDLSGTPRGAEGFFLLNRDCRAPACLLGPSVMVSPRYFRFNRMNDKNRYQSQTGAGFTRWPAARPAFGCA